jgi:hypothetical protein
MLPVVMAAPDMGVTWRGARNALSEWRTADMFSWWIDRARRFVLE